MERADGHRYYEGLAVAHVLGGLDDSEGQVFRSHLLECVDCRARVGELRAIAHDLADVERDERRMRAAQAIDTKRRGDDDGTEEPDETPDVTRASRITVIVGLVLVIGLSLWNFTLRGELTAQQQLNRRLVHAGTIQETGTEWLATTGDALGSVTVSEGQFVMALDGLKTDQLYGVYALGGGEVKRSYPPVLPSEGRIYNLYSLPEGTQEIVLTDPDAEGDNVGTPGSSPTGERVFVARPPAP
jgi:hypothetical protein